MKLWSRLLGASENTECLSLPLQDPVKKVDMSLSQDTDENTPVSLLGLKRCRSLDAPSAVKKPHAKEER